MIVGERLDYIAGVSAFYNDLTKRNTIVDSAEYKFNRAVQRLRAGGREGETEREEAKLLRDRT